MKVGLYVLKDIKLERYQPPFVCRDDNEARIIISRAGFSKAVYNDLDLYKVANFDDISGELSLDNKRIGLVELRGEENE